MVPVPPGSASQVAGSFAQSSSVCRIPALYEAPESKVDIVPDFMDLTKIIRTNSVVIYWLTRQQKGEGSQGLLRSEGKGSSVSKCKMGDKRSVGSSLEKWMGSISCRGHGTCKGPGAGKNW